MSTRLHRALRARADRGAADTVVADAGFSLIELLVVVVILGILAAVSVPMYMGIQMGARDASVKTDLAEAKTRMVMALMNADKYPQTMTELYAAGFTPGSKSSSGYTVEFALSNVTTTTFCLRARAVTDTTRDVWVSSDSGVVGPFASTEVSQRPASCQGS